MENTQSSSRKAQCQCGQLTAEVSGDAEAMTVLCHCVDCQRRSGSPFGTIAYYPEGSVSIAGEAREFTRLTDAGSSFTNAFCPDCGSSVYARAGKYPAILGVMVGAFADPGFPAPARSVFEQSRLAWTQLPDTIPRHPRGRDS